MRDPPIIDLNGVLRHWNPQHVTDIERRHHLPRGALFAAAFAEHRLHPAITGDVTDSQWRAGVVAALEHEHGGAAAERAVAEWAALPGESSNSSDIGFAKPINMSSYTLRTLSAFHQAIVCSSTTRLRMSRLPHRSDSAPTSIDHLKI
jgi:hypothetical protein